MTLDEINAFIDNLADTDARRILAIIEYGEHKCHGPRLTCCGVSRCEPCHTAHLRSSHPGHTLIFWNRIIQTDRLTWKSNTTCDPSKPKPVKRRAKLKAKNQPERYVPSDAYLELQHMVDKITLDLRAKGYNV